MNAQISSSYGDTALEAAAAFGRIDILILLLNEGADITSDSGRFQLKLALDIATENGHDAAAKFLKYHQICSLALLLSCSLSCLLFYLLSCSTTI